MYSEHIVTGVSYCYIMMHLILLMTLVFFIRCCFAQNQNTRSTSCLQHAVLRFGLRGSDLTEYLQKILSDCGTSLTTKQEMVQHCKEKLSCVLLELQKAQILPDRQVIIIGSLIGLEQNDIHKLTLSSTMKCDVDVGKIYTIILHVQVISQYLE